MSLSSRWLTQLIKWCEVGQKSHAWNRAQELSQLCPAELSELPAQLTAAMKKQQETQQ